MNSLLDAVDAEKQQQDALLETVARQRENARLVEQLQQSLDEERKQRAQDVCAVDTGVSSCRPRLCCCWYCCYCCCCYYYNYCFFAMCILVFVPTFP